MSKRETEESIEARRRNTQELRGQSERKRVHKKVAHYWINCQEEHEDAIVEGDIAAICLSAIDDIEGKATVAAHCINIVNNSSATIIINYIEILPPKVVIICLITLFVHIPISKQKHKTPYPKIGWDDVVVISGCGPLGLGMVAGAKKKVSIYFCFFYR